MLNLAMTWWQARTVEPHPSKPKAITAMPMVDDERVLIAISLHH